MAQHYSTARRCKDGGLVDGFVAATLAGKWAAGVCLLLAGLLITWPLLAAAWQWLQGLLHQAVFPVFTLARSRGKVGPADVPCCCGPMLLSCCCVPAACSPVSHVACAALVPCLLVSALMQVTAGLGAACLLPLVSAPSHISATFCSKVSLHCVDARPKTPPAQQPLSCPGSAHQQNIPLQTLSQHPPSMLCSLPCHSMQSWHQY